MSKESAAMEVLDGTLLSDGSLRLGGKNAQFRMDLSGSDHLDWVLVVKDALLTLGVEVSSIYPKVYFSLDTAGKRREKLWLNSRASSFLAEQYPRWYVNGLKVLPEDFLLTPCRLAHLHMGDGSTQTQNDGRYVRVKIATDSFRPDEVDRLVLQLQRLGIIGAHRVMNCRRDGKYRSYPEVFISESGSVNTFMELVEPYVCESFYYKMKRSKPMTHAEACLMRRLGQLRSKEVPVHA